MSVNYETAVTDLQKDLKLHSHSMQFMHQIRIRRFSLTPVKCAVSCLYRNVFHKLEAPGACGRSYRCEFFASSLHGSFDCVPHLQCIEGTNYVGRSGIFILKNIGNYVSMPGFMKYARAASE